MTADERLEILLNRANQTLSDLKRNHTAHERLPALNAVKEYRGMNTKGYVCEWDYEEYILHLTDMIDIMETALENTLGTLDWMQTKCCALCFRAYEDGSDACDTCDIGEGIPEDRRIDND